MWPGPVEMCKEGHGLGGAPREVDPGLLDPISVDFLSIPKPLCSIVTVRRMLKTAPGPEEKAGQMDPAPGRGRSVSNRGSQ